MSKLLTALLITLGVAAVGIPVGYQFVKKDKTVEIINQSYIKEAIPRPLENLQPDPEIKLFNVKKIITLESRNTVVFRGPVTTGSVSQVMTKLKKISRQVSKKTPIYLVIDSPGGSVFDGLSFLDFTKALPQKVHTVTLFGASMAFHIAQNLDKRYITTSGTMMSHRARGGLRGQFDGELESRYKMVKRALDYMDYKAAKRMGLRTKIYKKMIVNEYWVHGFDAVGDNAADERILVRCGKSMDGTEMVKLRSFFGTINAEFSKCPLIKAPVSVKFKRMKNETKRNKDYLKYLYDISFHNKNRFIKDVIDTDKLGEIFPIR